MGLNNHLNNFLEKQFGRKLVRVPKPRPFPKSQHPGEGNLIVEFTGASCIGKTTLFNHFLSIYGRSWKKELLVKEDLERMFRTLPTPSKMEERHARVFNAKCKHFQNRPDFSSAGKHYRLGKVLEFLTDDFLISSTLDHKLIMFQEHLFSRMYGELPEKEDLAPFLENRILISCSTSSANHLKYIAKRKRRGSNPILYRNYRGEALAQKAAFYRQKADRLTQALKANGAALLMVDTADDLSDNALKINEFIKNNRK